MLDEYDQIVQLGKDMVGVSGTASGAISNRQSAILHRLTLSTLVRFPPDISILGEQDGDAIVADCCSARNTDSAPAVIERISLKTGADVSAVALHPYAHALPADKDLPGAGPLRLIGGRLYVATHTALFMYDLSQLGAPHMLYEDLGGRASFIANRYAVVIMQNSRAPRKAAAIDLSEPAARIIWSNDSATWTVTDSRPPQGPTIQLTSNGFGGVTSTLVHFDRGTAIELDTSCDLATSSDLYVLTLCENPRRYEMYENYVRHARSVDGVDDRLQQRHAAQVRRLRTRRSGYTR